MARFSEINQAIEACYDAALEPAQWPFALQMLAESVEATSCAVRVCDQTHPFAADRRHKTTRAPDSTEHMQFTELWLSRIEGAPDPHIDSASRLNKAAPGFIVEDEITTPEERDRLPYYQEIARPGHREWYAAILFDVDGRKWCLPLFREAKKGPFELRDSRFFVQMAPHLSRIMSTAEKMTDVAVGPSLAAFDRIGCAAILLDHRGLVARFNEQADALMGPDLKIRHGRLCASDHLSTSRLQGLIANSVSARPGTIGVTDPIVIRRMGMPWLLAESVPITSFGHDVFSAGHVLLILTDLTTPGTPSKMLLAKAFQLTPAEARLAADLAAGAGIGPACARLGISRETARSQLRAIFAKTGTRRQAELTALLSRLRAAARH